MTKLCPSRQSNALRDSIAEYLRRILCKGTGSSCSRQHSCLNGENCGDDESEADLPVRSIVLVSGSCCFKTYLPDADVDLVLLTPSMFGSASDMVDLTQTFALLCEETYRKDQDQKASVPFHPPFQNGVPPNPPAAPATQDNEFLIRNIDFINARTKLLHCVVDSYSVDLTVNQIGVVASMLFLEEVDTEIGENHLFKRSIMLIKVRKLKSLSAALSTVNGESNASYRAGVCTRADSTAARPFWAGRKACCRRTRSASWSSTCSTCTVTCTTLSRYCGSFCTTTSASRGRRVC